MGHFDISTFRSYYYIDKIYRFIDHFAKFMNSSWENFKNINIVFPSLFLSFFKFSFFPSQNGRLMDEKKNRERNTNEHATHIFIPRFEKLLSKDRKLEFTLPSRIIIANLKLKLANSLPNQMFDYITTSPLLRNPSEKDRKAALYRVFRYTEIIFLSSVIVNRIHLVRSFFLARFTPLLSGHPASTPKNLPDDKSRGHEETRGMAKEGLFGGGYFGQRHARLSIPRADNLATCNGCFTTL